MSEKVGHVVKSGHHRFSSLNFKMPEHQNTLPSIVEEFVWDEIPRPTNIVIKDSTFQSSQSFFQEEIKQDLEELEEKKAAPNQDNVAKYSVVFFPEWGTKLLYEYAVQC